MIILFNGPPGSGKDVAADYFKEHGFKHLSFKYQLFNETINHYGVDQEWFMEGYNNREKKEFKSSKLDNLSRREAMIHVSENLIKPEKGLDYFGKLVAEEIDPEKDYVISDGGFIEELVPVLEKCGAENFVLVQLTREGCDFSTDSRRYFQGNHMVTEYVLNKRTDINEEHVLPEKFDVRMYRVHNNSTIENFYETIDIILNKEK